MGSVFELKLHQASDWTAFERNQLHALVARLSTHSAQDIAFGVSDDGDPWCAILDDSDDVVLHVARIRGRFVVHAAQENAVAEARDLWSAVTTVAGEVPPRDDRLPAHVFAAMAVEDVHETALLAQADETAFTPLHPSVATAVSMAEDQAGRQGDHVPPALGDPPAAGIQVVAGLSFEPLIATNGIAANGMGGVGDPAAPGHAPVLAEPVVAVRVEAVAPTPEAVVAHVALSPYAGAQAAGAVAAHAHDAAPPASNPFLLDDPGMTLKTVDGDGADDNAFRPASLDHAVHPTPATANPNVLLVGGWVPSDTGHPTFGVVAEVVGGRSGLMQSPPGAHVDFIAIGAEGATSVSSSQPVLGLDGRGQNLVTGPTSTLFHAPPAPANDFGPVSLDHLSVEPAIHTVGGVWASPDPLHGS